MRLIFLDFDGVLHRSDAPPGTTLPFEWTGILKHLLSDIDDVQVIVHSSWREQFEVETLRGFLPEISKWFGGAVGLGGKSGAIEAYLSSRSDVAAALVLDDQSIELKTHVPLTFVLCNANAGISDAGVQDRILSWLTT